MFWLIPFSFESFERNSKKKNFKSHFILRYGHRLLHAMWCIFGRKWVKHGWWIYNCWNGRFVEEYAHPFTKWGLQRISTENAFKPALILIYGIYYTVCSDSGQFYTQCVVMHYTHNEGVIYKVLHNFDVYTFHNDQIPNYNLFW